MKSGERLTKFLKLRKSGIQQLVIGRYEAISEPYRGALLRHYFMPTRMTSYKTEVVLNLFQDPTGQVDRMKYT
jgi:hypothetical protein